MTPRRALSTGFSLRAEPSGLAQELDRCFGGLPAAPDGDDVVTINVTPTSVDSTIGHFTPHPTGVITTVANVITQLALSDHRPKLHAGAVATEDGAAVVIGPPDAGKSTLTAALGQTGHSILSDDLIVCDHDASVTGLGRPVRLDRGREALFPTLFAHRPVSEWATDTWHVPLVDFPGDPAPEAVPISAIFFTRYRDGADLVHEPIEPVEALVRLVENVFPPLDRAGFVTLASVAATQQCHSLTYHRLDEAVAAVERLSGQPVPGAATTAPEPAAGTRLSPTVTWVGLPGGSVMFDADDGRVVGLDATATNELGGGMPPGLVTSEMMETDFLHSD